MKIIARSKTLAVALGMIAAGGVAGVAHATLLDGIVDTWTVAVSTVFDTTTMCDTDGTCTQPNGITVNSPTSISWGVTSGTQSGLDIGNSPTSSPVDTNGPAVSNITITHHNNPVNEPELASVSIVSTLTLTPFAPPGSGLPPTPLTFPVLFDETPNNADPCADGGAHGVGVNSPSCADIFVTSQNSLNFPFQYDLGQGQGLKTYFISFFEMTNGLHSLSSQACASAGASFPCLGFETPEGADTTVRFASLITTERVVIDVPEPASLALVGMGLAALGVAARRRRQR